MNKARFLTTPTVRQIDLLASLHNPRHFAPIKVGEFNLPGEIYAIAGIKEKKIALPKVVLDPKGSGSNHRFSQGEILEDSRWCIYLGKGILMVWDNAKVAIINRFDDLPVTFHAQVVNAFLKAPLMNRFHDFLKERISLTADYQPRSGNTSFGDFQGIDRKVEAIARDERSMIKD